MEEEAGVRPFYSLVSTFFIVWTRTGINISLPNVETKSSMRGGHFCSACSKGPLFFLYDHKKSNVFKNVSSSTTLEEEVDDEEECATRSFTKFTECAIHPRR